MKSSSESDFGDYLSTLKKKTSGNNMDIHIDGLSDFSLSDLSENPIEIKSKFLKKNSEKIIPNNSKVKSKNKKGKKATKLKIKDKNKKLEEKKLNTALSQESDANMSLSDTSYIPKLQLSKIKSNLTDNSVDGDSNFGKDGNRFLKKSKKDVQKNEPQIVDTMRNTWSDDFSSSRNMLSPRKSTLKSTQSPLNKKNESQEFIFDKQSYNLKKVTILENKNFDSSSSLDFDAQNSVEEESQRQFDPDSESDKNFCGMNIMSFNDLVEGDTEQSKRDDVSSPIYSRSSKFEKIMSLDDLEDQFSSEVIPEKPVENFKDFNNSHDNTDSLSEIKTLPTVSPRKSKSLSKRQSFSEIKSISQNDQSEKYSKTSKLYSMDFEDSIKEEIQFGSYVSTRKNKKSQSYSSDFTDEDGTLRSVSKINSTKEAHKANKPIKLKKIENTHAAFPPKLLKEKIDPVPIAQYIVSPEALESLTAYSPSMLLMTNMFRQQLQMTTDFINTQHRLYESLISTLQPTYHYSTMQDFREFIKVNKKNLS